MAFETEKFGKCSCAMLIGIDNTVGRISGHIVQYNLARPVPFDNPGELVLRIEEICRYLEGGDQPRAGTAAAGFRTMDGKCRKKIYFLPEKYRQLRDLSAGQRLPRNILTRETFYLEVIGRQHMSLQGRLKGRRTRSQYVYFRSALELMAMICQPEKKPEDEERHTAPGRKAGIEAEQGIRAAGCEPGR